jgi:hypothetical protein
VSGVGFDDEVMLAGVQIFSAVGGHEVTAFAGSAGALFSDGRRLYAEPDRLEVWDPVTATVPALWVRPDGPSPWCRGVAAAVDGVLRWPSWRPALHTRSPPDGDTSPSRTRPHSTNYEPPESPHPSSGRWVNSSQPGQCCRCRLDHR